MVAHADIKPGRARRKVSVDLPSDVVQVLGHSPAEAAECLKQLAFIELFRRGEVSSGYAAEVLGMRRWDFIKLLGEHGVPYVDMTPEELAQDAEAARMMAERARGTSPTPAP